jgi:hypothetical protein
MESTTLSLISQSLPETFPFYGMGDVSLVKNPKSTSPISALVEGKDGVSFKLLGEPAVLLVVLFDKNLDSSMYSELGNILASKLCTGLSEEGEGDLMITPPYPLKSEQLKRLASVGLPFIHRSYEHVNQDKTVLIEALILPITAEGQIGHA